MQFEIADVAYTKTIRSSTNPKPFTSGREKLNSYCGIYYALVNPRGEFVSALQAGYPSAGLSPCPLAH
jgi:hypothetical protein